MAATGWWRDVPDWVRPEARALTIALGKFMLVCIALECVLVVLGGQPEAVPAVVLVNGAFWFFLAFLGLNVYWPWAFRSYQHRQMRKAGIPIPGAREWSPRIVRFSATVEMAVGLAILILFAIAFAGGVADIIEGTAASPGGMLFALSLFAGIISLGGYLLWRGWRKWRRIGAAQSTSGARTG